MHIFRRIFLSNYWWQKINSRQTGSRNMMGPKTLPTIWGTYMKLVIKYQISALNSCWEKWDYMSDLVGFYTHWTYMHIFRHIFLSNYWWQKSDIWSQASYRYTILWVAFLNPSDSYFLFADLVGFYTHWTYMHIFRHIFVTKYQISAINSCWEKCDEKWAYMFNVSKIQQSRQTGSRNPMGSKTLPVDFYTHLTYICICTFFSATIDVRNLIFGHKLHIGMPYCGRCFWTRQTPTSCLPT
jgi:hypothetical protein